MPRQPTDHAGLEVLPLDECLKLLASEPVGRVGFYADGELVMLPVNHILDGQDIVFRAARGSKLSAAEGHSLVAFEADSYDGRSRSGWSVVVNGHAEVVYDDAEISRLDRVELHPWPPSDLPCWIRIRATAVSGRRIPRGQAEPPPGGRR
jgi:nitroimidazol reductase NimA-like FMN-containing flavoprotein (pyridoxamine 5'-phosphate oxidase superfamily)